MSESPSSIEWLAGWFEARGHILCQARETKHRLSGNMVRNDHFGVAVCGPATLLRALVERYGGRFDERDRADRASIERRWRAYNVNAAKFLSDIIPHARIRRDEFETAMLFFGEIRRGRVGSRSVPGRTGLRREELARAVDLLRPRRQGYREAREKAKQMRSAMGA